MKKVKRKVRGFTVTADDMMSVPVIGWRAARELARIVGEQTLRVDSLQSACYQAFQMADHLVRRSDNR